MTLTRSRTVNGRHGSYDYGVDGDACNGTRSVTCATKTSKKKMDAVEAACEEINARWQLEA